MGLRLAQEKALKRQLEEEQKLKPGGVGAPTSTSASARPGAPAPDEAMDFREEGPEGETPAIFISVDDDSGLPEAAVLDPSLEGPPPKVGPAPGAAEEGAPGRVPVSVPGCAGGAGAAPRPPLTGSPSARRRQPRARPPRRRRARRAGPPPGRTEPSLPAPPPRPPRKPGTPRPRGTADGRGGRGGRGRGGALPFKKK